MTKPNATGVKAPATPERDALQDIAKAAFEASVKEGDGPRRDAMAGLIERPPSP